ncbi:S8 family peptidase [Pedobacter frigoris]|uniref:S8 family peptidase n=1 Tax=Pedobacter frigoris TaxID=2571272 RepID=A0A4U1CF65_9SPHI|nr:S8 family peptidase [Pedobacter frigoris]TKC02934.1 S8 family peptidase [Pedobacter frigoris]
MAKFPHLPLKTILDGNYKFKGFNGGGKSQRSIDNLNNRKAHGETLKLMAEGIKQFNGDVIAWRKEQGLPDLPDEHVIPLLLHVDPKVFNIETLKGFGIEVIAEEDSGLIMGASVDQFKSLKEKISKFLKDKNQGTALLWQIEQGQQWRPEYILSEDLYWKWLDGFGDDEQFTVDISISCHVKKSEYPVQGKKTSNESFERSILNWYENTLVSDAELDQLMMERQEQAQTFIELGGGNLVGGFVEYRDSFGLRAELSGKALRDIVLNYPYVFEIAEHCEIENQTLTHEDFGEIECTILPPSGDSPNLCIIDSGIQQDHLLLEPAILSDRSMNFVPNETSVADHVSNGGHGTKVAGAVLYGAVIPRTGTVQAPFFLTNMRVLDANKAMSSLLFEPELMHNIVDHNPDISIFNLSINSHMPCRVRHMSQWASAIDMISHEDKKMFVVSTGNIYDMGTHINRPGIKEHLAAGRQYPNYLLEPSSRIADPAQSIFAITVGSVCLDEFEDLDRVSFGKKDYPSSFSRSGMGMWGAIKPEVVEYGGDWIREKAGTNLSMLPVTSPELVKTGLHGVGRGDIGTSFSTPKVTHILGQLQKLFPTESVLFYKALLIQSARLPEIVWHDQQARHLRHMGYGIPSLDRAIDNTPYRITFTETGKIAPKKAKIFSVKVPDEMRKQGEAYDILIEVSLCYTAEPRRTRKNLRSYLSAWLSWDSSKLGQSTNAFHADVLKEMDENFWDQDTEEPEDPHSIKWTIWSNSKWGKIKDIRRQASANQKDWVVLKSFNLPAELSFAVIGHKGWENDLNKEIPYAFVVSFEILNSEIEIYDIMQQVNVEIPVQAEV